MSDDGVVKLTLRGPAPWGGSYTTFLDDHGLDQCLQEGWEIRRVWITRGKQHPIEELYSREKEILGVA